MTNSAKTLKAQENLKKYSQNEVDYYLVLLPRIVFFGLW